MDRTEGGPYRIDSEVAHPSYPCRNPHATVNAENLAQITHLRTFTAQTERLRQESRRDCPQNLTKNEWAETRFLQILADESFGRMTS
jgi:UTP:GlnB (protein PII) uridylyltransferase